MHNEPMLTVNLTAVSASDHVNAVEQAAAAVEGFQVASTEQRPTIHCASLTNLSAASKTIRFTECRIIITLINATACVWSNSLCHNHE